jgi:chitinase
MAWLSSRAATALLHIVLSIICLHGILAPNALARAANEECGKDAGGKLCPLNVCCSQWGFCGT